MTLRRTLLPLAASALLLTGCGSDAVEGLSRGGTVDTANFRLQLPSTLYQAEAPDSDFWDYSFVDRSGYTISVQDFDYGYAPTDLLGMEYEASDARFEQGTLGPYTYCGWTAEEEPNCVLKFAAGIQGRLIFAQASVPKNKTKRAKTQICELLENMTFIGKPLAAGSISTGFATIDYPETWVVSSDSSEATVIMHPAVNKNDVTVIFSATDTPNASAKALAEEQIEMTADALPGYYSETALIEQKLLGYDAYIARLCFGEPEDEDGRVIQDYAYIDTPQGVCTISLYYSDPGVDEFIEAFNTLTLTFHGDEHGKN